MWVWLVIRCDFGLLFARGLVVSFGFILVICCLSL